MFFVMDYLGKFSKLVKNPEKIMVLPRFLAREPFRLYLLHKGEYSISANDCEASFFVDSDSEAIRFYEFSSESKFLEFVLGSLEEDSVFWDVGANIGIFSCLVGDKVVNGGVVGFEPLDENFERLKQNADLNGLDIRCFQKVLQDENNEVFLKSPSREVGEGEASIGEQGLKVDGTTGDFMIEEHGLEVPDVIKIDVEGAELKVLKGLKNVLNSGPKIFVEIHPERLEEFGNSEDELVVFMENHGFECEVIQNRGAQKHVLFSKSL